MIDLNNPNPQFARGSAILLDGEWGFAFDEAAAGDAKGFKDGFAAEENILVPFVYNCAESGVESEKQIDVVWYERELIFSAQDLQQDTILHFEGVDYRCDAWLNGHYLGFHEGAYSSFAFVLNEAAKRGKNLLVIKATDDFSVDHPRGKQRWLNDNFGCWYRQANGIYRSVWLERAPRLRLDWIKITPLYNEEKAQIDFAIAHFVPGTKLRILLSFKEQNLGETVITPAYATGSLVLDLASPKLTYQVESWHPYNPALYEADILTEGPDSVDKVHTYFGDREFTARGHGLYLNGFSFYLKYCLYQGYWADSNLTEPSLEAVKKDIILIKEMGFNGIRLHQFIADERFLALCDTLGLSVWCELPSPRAFNAASCEKVRSEWLAILHQKYNHPSIFAWVAINESWGVQEILVSKPQQAFVDSLVADAKAVDAMRPVISNDGWEHTHSDILTVHNYEQNAEVLKKYYSDWSGLLAGAASDVSMRRVYADGYSYQGEPVVISEFGGCAFASDAKKGWGYGKSVEGQEGYYARLDSLISAIYALPGFSGFCYTQYSDVQQEKNGFVTEDRRLKVDPKKIKDILDRRP
jgi:beta-galactosidase/beta-glucuronidase